MTKSVKIPKTIAGGKLPKKARKTANKAIKMGASPIVRELAAAAIGAAGGKAAGERKNPPNEENGSGGRAHFHGRSGAHRGSSRPAGKRARRLSRPCRCRPRRRDGAPPEGRSSIHKGSRADFAARSRSPRAAPSPPGSGSSSYPPHRSAA